MVKLIIHPGAGKTGTTSIQNALQDQYSDLLDQRIGYLGMSFENTIKSTPPEETNDELFSLKHRLGRKILEDPRRVLEFSTKQINLYLAENPNVETLVWSNESLVNQQDWFSSFMGNLSGLISIKTIYGVRDPSKWIISAYFQWGNDSDFMEFALKRSLANPGKKWERESREFDILDLDREQNIVEKFFDTIGYTPPNNLPKYKKNRTIDKPEATNEKLLRYADLLSSDIRLSAWVDKENAGIRNLRRLSREK